MTTNQLRSAGKGITREGEPFFPTGTAFVDSERVDMNRGFGERGGREIQRWTSYSATGRPAGGRTKVEDATGGGHGLPTAGKTGKLGRGRRDPEEP